MVMKWHCNIVVIFEKIMLQQFNTRFKKKKRFHTYSDTYVLN